MQLPKIPNVADVPDGGQLFFASNGDIVLIGLQAGGLSIAPPVWMRTHYLQAFNLVGQFVAQCSVQQADNMQKLVQQLKGH
jgi:hypothetical protein